MPEQYSYDATLPGNASDGPPGVAGIGEQTAASLLAAHGTLDELLAAAMASGAGLSAPVRSKLAASAGS